jgi:hypothetical protein
MHIRTEKEARIACMMKQMKCARSSRPGFLVRKEHKLMQNLAGTCEFCTIFFGEKITLGEKITQNAGVRALAPALYANLPARAHTLT